MDYWSNSCIAFPEIFVYDVWTSTIKDNKRKGITFHISKYAKKTTEIRFLTNILKYHNQIQLLQNALYVQNAGRIMN